MFKPKNWLTNWRWQGVETTATSSLTKQVAFIDQLLDIVMIHDAAEDPLTKSMLTPGVVRWEGGGGFLRYSVTSSQPRRSQLSGWHRIYEIASTHLIHGSHHFLFCLRWRTGAGHNDQKSKISSLWQQVEHVRLSMHSNLVQVKQGMLFDSWSLSEAKGSLFSAV